MDPPAQTEVTIHFTARVVDGDIFETTREDDTGPLKFRIGHGEVMRGLEESAPHLISCRVVDQLTAW